MKLQSFSGDLKPSTAPHRVHTQQYPTNISTTINSTQWQSKVDNK